MLVTDTPSIVSQRIVLAVFFVALIVMGSWQAVGGSFDARLKKFTTTAVPSVAEPVDFTAAEAAWSDLQIDSQGNLRIDALTESALLDAIALMRGPRAEQTIARMAALLEKQFGTRASQQIVELLPLLKSYKDAEQRWWQDNGGKHPQPHAELFQLQDELLGEALAKKLFSEQRRLTNIMLASQKIRTDPSLTQAQKHQALVDLQTAEVDGEPGE